MLLRPAVSSDGEAIRTLFHRLSERDVFSRFFRKVHGVSSEEVQRLCNLNFENEVAFVAVTGTREDPQIVAQSCYFTDPSTNIAETAFMVHPQWQGCGLGAVLQQRMTEHAQARGVRGFVAEIHGWRLAMPRLTMTAQPGTLAWLSCVRLAGGVNVPTSLAIVVTLGLAPRLPASWLTSALERAIAYTHSCPGCAVDALRWSTKPANLIRFIPA